MADDKIHTQAIVDFYNGMVQNDAKTKAAGRPIFDDQEMIRIRWAGNTKSELHAPANDRSDRKLKNDADNSWYYPKWKDHPDFAKAYAAFKAGQEHAVNGTPISELPFLTEARRAELKAVNIHTAEQLVGVDPNSKLGSGLSDLRRQAQLYLERAKGAAVDAIHEQERAAMQADIAALRQQLDMVLSGQSANTNAAPAPKAAPKATATGVESDPAFQTFNSMDDTELRQRLLDGGETPHNRCNHATLVRMAVEMNNRLKAANTLVAA